MVRLPHCVVSATNSLCYALGRSPAKEACAEFLATFVLVVLGDGVMASCVLGRLDLNAIVAGAFGWGFAVMAAVAIAGGVSGGHVNPAVTVSLASGGKCSWKSVVPYMIAQYTASFFAAAAVYLTYVDALRLYDGGMRQVPPSVNSTAQIFATYPQDFASMYTCFLDQVVGSALLLIVICAATDYKTLKVPPHAQPMLIGLGITGIILAFGFNCGAPLNPARDFAPRLFTAISGWGVAVFKYRNYEWFWVPIVAPHVGGVIGVWLYKLLIEVPVDTYRRLSEAMEYPEIVNEEGCLDSPNSSESANSSENCPQIVIEKVYPGPSSQRAVLSRTTSDNISHTLGDRRQQNEQASVSPVTRPSPVKEETRAEKVVAEGESGPVS